MTAFPETATIEVPSALAADLSNAAGRCPPAAPADYYDTAVQSRARDEIRAGCPGGFDRLVADIRTCLAAPPFAALVRGLEYDDSHRVFVAVCRSLGELISPPREHNPRRAQLLHFIRPAEDLKAASGQALTERLHTDAADWPDVPAVIAMICVRPDPMGFGRSRLLDVISLRAAIERELGARALALLEQETVPWQLADYLGDGFVQRPISDRGHGALAALHDRVCRSSRSADLTGDRWLARLGRAGHRRDAGDARVPARRRRAARDGEPALPPRAYRPGEPWRRSRVRSADDPELGPHRYRLEHFSGLIPPNQPGSTRKK